MHSCQRQHGVREPDEFEAAFAEMASKRIGALVVIDDAMLTANAQTLAQIALRQRLCLRLGGRITVSPVACWLMGPTLPTCSDAQRTSWTRF